MNDFKTDLDFSLKASLENFWDQVYEKAFVDLKETRICNNLDWQRLGVDRFIHLKSGRVFAVDEKIRRVVYEDILLEYISADTTNSPGWIEKQMAIDYLAYAFLPIKRVYLFDWPMLRRSWVKFGEQWKKQYRIVKAVNNDYNTLSVAVPISVLRKTAHLATIVEVA